MSFAVEWTDEALSALAAVWLAVPVSDRMAVTKAQAEIDRLLADDPENNGSELSEGLLAIVVRPLRALYEVSKTDAQVVVVAVKLAP